MIRRGFVLGAVASLVGAKAAKADGILTVSNRGQIVSTGDVYTRQAAGGTQIIYDSKGNAIAAVSNDAQIVSTGNVYNEQSAAGTQAVYGSGGGGGGGNSGQCRAGEYQQQGNCVSWCSDQCEWLTFCCDNKDSNKKKCCK
jgi:hypothetical protein